MTMAELIIPQNVLEARIEEQRSRIIQASGILGIAIITARHLQENEDASALDDLEGALASARELLDDIHDDLEPGPVRLFKPEAEVAHG
jgi:hypothetical protein